MLSKRSGRVLFTASVLILLAGFISVGVVSAAKPSTNGVHFKNPGVDCERSGFTITCAGTVVGLGDNTVTAHLDMGVDATIECTNNGGQLVEVKTHSEASTEVNLSSSDNNLDFLVVLTAEEPTFANPRLAGCPNNNWDYDITDFSVGSFSFYWCFGNTLINQLTVLESPTSPTPQC